MDKRLHPDTFIRLYKSVVSNAAIWNGEPIIVGTKQRAFTVWRAVIIMNKPINYVAGLCNISIDNVRDAVVYYKKIKSPVKDKETFRKFTSNVSD